MNNKTALQEPKIKKPKKEKCQSCGKKEATSELHSCPYASEINDDDSESCNCCPDCEYECCMAI